MYFSRHSIEEFPFHGVFYDVEQHPKKNGDRLFLEYVVTTTYLKTRCDIQQVVKDIKDGTIMAAYTVFFPCEVGQELDIKLNTLFKCEDYLIPIKGYVTSIEYSQLGGCSVGIKVNAV